MFCCTDGMSNKIKRKNKEKGWRRKNHEIEFDKGNEYFGLRMFALIERLSNRSANKYNLVHCIFGNDSSTFIAL